MLKQMDLSGKIIEHDIEILDWMLLHHSQRGELTELKKTSVIGFGKKRKIQANGKN